MSQARSFINHRTQSYPALKASTPVSGHARAKFDVLNGHIVNSVVLAGELVIIGDPTTPSCTSHEAFLMGKAAYVHSSLLASGVEDDDFFLENFDLLQDVLANAAIGIGAASDGWSRHLNNILSTLKEIKAAHHDYLRSGPSGRDAFYAKRTALFMKLEEQLSSIAAYGSGLRKKGKIKHALGLSTKSFLHHGEIAGYADKVFGVARASNLAKKGAYIGIPLDMASTALEIHKACTEGREEECRRAKYVESSALVGSLGGGAVGGQIGGHAGRLICGFALGATTGGIGAIGCAVLGGAVGGMVFGDLGGKGAKALGSLVYMEVTE
ncbi:hypothetical protein [Pseudomonas massiliensis]|uniref:hypothetical protein n=1 Tax=Pseudomonas massiliensis TaxID=522492 RepID=UPI00058AF7CB|nr:hypothetical protein [Pseudomonas massiliensis]